jgi:hypothetical protein
MVQRRGDAAFVRIRMLLFEPRAGRGGIYKRDAKIARRHGSISLIEWIYAIDAVNGSPARAG